MARTLSKHNNDKCCGKTMDFAGPLWTGNLWDTKLARKISVDFAPKKEGVFCRNIANEAFIDTIGIYDLHKLSKIYQIKPPKPDNVIKALKKKKFKASRTHINNNYIRTNASIQDIVKILKN